MRHIKFYKTPNFSDVKFLRYLGWRWLQSLNLFQNVGHQKFIHELKLHSK